MRHVKATSASIDSQIPISELNRIATEGEEFECSENRFIWLSGHNRYRLVFAVDCSPKEEVIKKKKDK